MATIRVNCPACNAELEVDERYAGEEVECGSCFERFVAQATDGPRSERPSRRRTRKDEDDEDYEYDRPRRRRRTGGGGGGGNGAAISALIMGILALLTSCFCGCLSIPLSIGAIISGSVGMKNPEGRGMAVTGMILGGLALAVFVVALLAGVGMNLGKFNNPGQFRRGR